MRLQVVLLLCQVLFNLSQVHQLWGILLTETQRLVYLLLELCRFTFVLCYQVLLYLLSLLLVLSHLVVPVIIKLCNFLHMSNLNLFFLFLMLVQHLSSLSFLYFSSHLRNSFLSQISLHVLPCLLTLLLMSVKDLPFIKQKSTCIIRCLLLRNLACSTWCTCSIYLMRLSFYCIELVIINEKFLTI